jgi:hypothetical protein
MRTGPGGQPVKRFAFLASIFATVLVVVLPFVGGGGPSPLDSAAADTSTASIVGAEHSTNAASATPVIQAAQATAALALLKDDIASAITPPVTTDSEHIAQKPVPKPQPAITASEAASGTQARRAARAAAGGSCPGNVGGAVGGAPSAVSAGGVPGTTSGDLSAFALKYNAIRVANCLAPVPLANFRYDSCMEQRLFWMAEDPSPDPASAWGHIGSVRSDGVPSVGCDGNLAGGSGNSGATVAQKWWDSLPHRTSLYKPTYGGSTAGVCIYFAMTHGDGALGAESYSFTRAAAKWSGC